MKYVGVDIGNRECRAAFIDGVGGVVEEFSFRNDFDDIERFVSRLSPDDEIIMESTGNLWVNMYDALEERGFRLRVTRLMRGYLHIFWG